MCDCEAKVDYGNLMLIVDPVVPFCACSTNPATQKVLIGRIHSGKSSNRDELWPRYSVSFCLSHSWLYF